MPVRKLREQLREGVYRRLRDQLALTPHAFPKAPSIPTDLNRATYAKRDKLVGALRVPCNDLYGVEVGVELTVDAVYKAEGAPHEEQFVWDVTDA